MTGFFPVLVFFGVCSIIITKKMSRPMGGSTPYWGSTPLPGNSTNRPPAIRGGRRNSRWGAHVPKAQGLKCRGRGPRPCNTEGARREWHDRWQRNYLRIIIIMYRNYFADFMLYFCSLMPMGQLLVQCT